MKHLTQIEEKVPQGTSPFIIDSTTVVPNLNADQLDGKHASDFVLTTSAQYTDLTDGGDTTLHTHEVASIVRW